ncbi:MAG: hypothetical protein Q8M29_16260 [Bacteroidota bacterium]|nr:hypothetical protein [Bacteroidota bacterium]
MPCICKTPQSNTLSPYTGSIENLSDSSTQLYNTRDAKGETGVYKCNLCETIWLFEYTTNDTDRPPCFLNYRKITAEEFKVKFGK